MSLYWVSWKVPEANRTLYGDTVSRLFRAPSQVDAREQAEQWKGPALAVTLVAQDPVCGPCPHHEFCMTSKWNEHSPTEGDVLTSVHTCALCMERVLSPLSMEDPHKKVVPEGCHRWHPIAGSACLCSACMAEDLRLERAHPSYKTRMEAASLFMKALFVEEGQQEGMRKDVVSKLAEAWTPMSHMPIAANYDAAAKALGILTGFILAHQGLQEAWEQVPEDRQVETRYRWLEALQLALGRHKGDMVAVVHEFMFAFHRVVPLFRVWYQLSVQERKGMMGVWAHSLRLRLNGEPIAGEG